MYLVLVLVVGNQKVVKILAYWLVVTTALYGVSVLCIL